MLMALAQSAPLHTFVTLRTPTQITLMETDDFEDLTPGADQETLSSESSPVMMSAAMETKAALVQNVDMLEDGDLEVCVGKRGGKCGH